MPPFVGAFLLRAAAANAQVGRYTTAPASSQSSSSPCGADPQVRAGPPGPASFLPPPRHFPHTPHQGHGGRPPGPARVPQDPLLAARLLTILHSVSAPRSTTCRSPSSPGLSPPRLSVPPEAES